jgi:hypothetical protein
MQKDLEIFIDKKKDPKEENKDHQKLNNWKHKVGLYLHFIYCMYNILLYINYKLV